VNVNLNLSLSGQADLVVLSPTYTFADARAWRTIVRGCGELVRQELRQYRRDIDGGGGPNRGDAQRSTRGLPDLLWRRRTDRDAALESGRQQYMVYVTGDIPAGDYSPTRLANLGIGHGTIDAGGAYTYFNPATATNFRLRPASPTISRIRTRNIETVSISTSTGARRIS